MSVAIASLYQLRNLIMKKRILNITAFAFIFLSSTLQAASISLNTRAIDQGIDNSDFISTWGRQTSKITTTSLDEFTGFKSGHNSLSNLSVEFIVGKTADWGFRAGLDAHYGATLYLDGIEIGSRTDDLWWAKNWKHSDVMNLLGNNLIAGAHILDIYWAETCCNGISSVEFMTENSDWESLSVANLEAASVPEPVTLALLAIGMVILGTQSRNKGNDLSYKILNIKDEND